MEDVPIFIFFCTDQKQMSFIDKMLADRDNDSASEDQTFNADVKPPKKEIDIKDSIVQLIQGTRNKFQPFRNIHIMQGNDEKVLMRYKETVV